MKNKKEWKTPILIEINLKNSDEKEIKVPIE